MRTDFATGFVGYGLAAEASLVWIRALTVLDDLPRGVRSRRLNEQQTPLSAWVDPDAIAKSEVLRFSPSKIFLGLIGG